MSEKNGRAFIIALEGDLGAGKTTFVQTLAKELGVVGTLQSPTYVLMKKYSIPPDSLTSDVMGRHFTTLIHIDAYRLNDPKEIEALRPEEFLNDPATLVCIEWPEKVAGSFPRADITITFSSESVGEGERFIEMQK